MTPRVQAGQAEEAPPDTPSDEVTGCSRLTPLCLRLCPTDHSLWALDFSQKTSRSEEAELLAKPLPFMPQSPVRAERPVGTNSKGAGSLTKSVVHSLSHSFVHAPGTF